MFFVILLYALFASVFTISKTGLEYSDPLFFVGSRMMIAGFFLILFQFIFHRESFSIKKEHFFRIFRLALFNIYLTNVFEFWGLKHLTSFKTCFIYSLSPFISALLSYMIFSEKLSFKKWIGLVVGFLGFIPILLSQTAQEEQTGHLFYLSFAELAVIGAVISSVYGWILLSQLVKENGYSPILANGLSMFIGGAISLFHSSLVENWDPSPVSSWMPFLSCTFLLIVISNFICYNLYGVLLKKYSPTFMSVAGFTTAFFSALFGWIYLGEVITWPFYLSAVIVFCGLLLFYRQEIEDSSNKSVEKLLPNVL